MSKPPDSPPSSDIDGVHSDRLRRNDPAAAKSHPDDGEDLARRESLGRPADTKR